MDTKKHEFWKMKLALNLNLSPPGEEIYALRLCVFLRQFAFVSIRVYSWLDLFLWASVSICVHPWLKTFFIYDT